jgi:ABC-2 type transport system permease protein
MLNIHIPLLVALVTGDLISGEAAMGTLRLLVSKPISRTQLLLSKFLAGGIYTLLVVLWLGFLAVIVGQWLFGVGDLMVLNSDGLVILQADDVNWRYAGGFCVAFLALLTVSSLSITLSCFSDNSIGPIVSTMAIILLFTIIVTLDVPIFDPIRPYLFTTHMAAWRSFFEDPLPWESIKKSIYILLGHNLLFIGISLFAFHRKDITV